MSTRRSIVTGIGLSLLAGGCSTDARRHFEVSPAGPSETAVDAPVARPVPQLAFTGSSPDGASKKAKPARKSQDDAAPSDSSPAQSPDDQNTRESPARAAAPVADGVDWLNPDHFTLSNSPGETSPVTPDRRAARPQAAKVRAKGGGEDAHPSAEADSNNANTASQIADPPATPASEAPIPASAQMQASHNDPAFLSMPGGVTATAVPDADALGHKFSQRMRDYPTDVAAHLDYQMLRFLRDETVPQLDTISTLPSEDRNLLTTVMDGLSNFRTGLRANKNMLLSEKVQPILDLADRVRSQAQLTIPVIAICSTVQAFGVYDPMSTTLRAGVDNPIVIYCEVANFSAEQDDKGFWETKLSQEAVLYNDGGIPAWHERSVVSPDLSRTRRHDFFVAKKVMLPRNLAIGRYNLKVSIFDEQVKRVAENSVAIELMAQ